MDFDIYFFGTPYGFDLYPEVFEKATYYQSFYDGSKENSKLTVHRCPNGLVVYSYLRYNLVDYQSRARAFFGISIVFNETYCTDIVNLYELFEGVYNKVILQQGILLKPLNAQTMFAVRTLKEAADEIKRVENIIRKNIINVFANDLYKLDTSFKLNVNENKVCKLNPQEGNNTILQTSREFPMFSLSSEYTTKASNTAVASEQLQVFGNLLYKIKQEIEVLRSESDKLQNQITVRNALQGSEQARKEQEVKLFYRELNDKVGKFFSEISNAQKQIQHFLQNNPEHPQLKGFLNEFNVQKDILTKKQEALSIFGDLIRTFAPTDINTEPVSRVTRSPQASSVDTNISTDCDKNVNIHLWWNKIKSKHIASFVTMLIIGGLLWFFYPTKISSLPDESPTYLRIQVLLNEADSLINLKPPKFNEALTKYQEANTLEWGIAENKITQLNNKAIDYYKQLAQSESNSFDPIGTKKKIDCYNSAIEALEKAKQFGYADAEANIEELKKRTITYYEREIDSAKGMKRRREYAEVILSLNPNNAKAMEVLSKSESYKAPGISSPSSISSSNVKIIIRTLNKIEEIKGNDITTCKGAIFDISMGEGYKTSYSWDVTNTTIIRIDKKNVLNSKMTILGSGRCGLQIKNANGKVITERYLNITVL